MFKKMHKLVKNHGCHNYRGARIPVTSGLNITSVTRL